MKAKIKAVLPKRWLVIHQKRNEATEWSWCWCSHGRIQHPRCQFINFNSFSQPSQKLTERSLRRWTPLKWANWKETASIYQLAWGAESLKSRTEDQSADVMTWIDSTLLSSIGGISATIQLHVTTTVLKTGWKHKPKIYQGERKTWQWKKRKFCSQLQKREICVKWTKERNLTSNCLMSLRNGSNQNLLTVILPKWYRCKLRKKKRKPFDAHERHKTQTNNFRGNSEEIW